MNLITYDELLEIRASRGIVKDFSPPSVQKLQNPPSDRKVMLDMFRFDPVIWTALNLTADMVTYNGFDFYGEDEDEIKSARKKFNEELDFDVEIKNIIIQMLIYGESFLEMKGEGITEIHALEGSEINLKYDINGKIEQFVQKPTSPPISENQYPTWEVDEVIYFRMYQIGARVYSYNMMDSIHKAYITRLWSNYYLEQLFKNNIPKMVYFIENANKEQREAFRENVIRAKSNPAMDIVGVGKATAQILQYEFNNGFKEVMQEIRKEVLMVTRVPPHWIGDLGGMNRGIGENIVIPFETNVQKIQQIVGSYINKELMPKLKYAKTKFRFNPISLLSEKSILQNAQVMAGLGIEVTDETRHPVIDYLRNKGFDIPVGAKIVSQSKKDIDSFLSRQRENPMTDKMGSGIDRHGVSSAGMEKLEEKQIAVA